MLRRGRGFRVYQVPAATITSASNFSNTLAQIRDDHRSEIRASLEMIADDFFLQIRGCGLRQENERVRHLINSGLLGDGGWRHGGRGCRRQVGYRSCCACSGQSVWSGARGAGRSLSVQREPILEPGISRLYCSLGVRCGDPAHRVGRGPYDVFEKFLNLLRTSPNLCSVYNDLNKVWNGHPIDAYGEVRAACIASALKQDATSP
jgi:hypothetical protein